MTQIEYHIGFPQFKNQIENNKVSFIIGNMKCGNPNAFAVVYFVLHGFDNRGVEICPVGDKAIYTSKRWVVDNTYSQYVEEFIVSDSILDDLVTIKVELVAIGVDDDNPLYFSHCMLTDDPFAVYHATNEEISSATVNLNNTAYAELYNNRFDGFLQIIRPNKKAFTTDTLTANDVTVIAPHLNNENLIDKSQNLVLEFLNQVDQITTIYMDNFIE